MLRCDKDAFEALVIGVIVSADCLRYPLHGQQGFVCQEIRDRAVEVGKRKTIALLHIHRADMVSQHNNTIEPRGVIAAIDPTMNSSLRPPKRFWHISASLRAKTPGSPKAAINNDNEFLLGNTALYHDNNKKGAVLKHILQIDNGMDIDQSGWVSMPFLMD